MDFLSGLGEEFYRVTVPATIQAAPACRCIHEVRRRHEVATPVFRTDDRKEKKQNGVETSSLVTICNALAYALMKPWIPTPFIDPTPPATPGLESPTLKKGKDKEQKTNTATVLEYVLEVTGGGIQGDIVQILVHMLILQTWPFTEGQKPMSSHMQTVGNEMLSFSSGLLEQSLVDNMGGKNAIRWEALSAFLNSARFAMKADN
ncbi:hypothetical protein MAR_008514 [Mya arenaria]|uniref:Uncharacterized protein n=1 Tax=Mya arenaria TaxID=6604 RepID=A0ABY7DZ62_MYAAR|nr:hypothetical protein MAR_008514 [Mya arenaria]